MSKIFLLALLIPLTSCADRAETETTEEKEKAVATEPGIPGSKPSVQPYKPKPKTKPKPQLIAGKYIVKSTQRGKMSWYSVKTNGGTKTASGKKFSDSGATAAHRTLRFGTKVRVTNVNNGRTQIVTITDRGPFIKGRIIDVSIGIARKLNFVNAGVVSCKVEVLGTP